MTTAMLIPARRGAMFYPDSQGSDQLGALITSERRSCENIPVMSGRESSSHLGEIIMGKRHKTQIFEEITPRC